MEEMLDGTSLEFFFFFLIDYLFVWSFLFLSFDGFVSFWLLSCWGLLGFC